MPSESPARLLEEIRRLYYAASAGTIQRDLARAIDLFKSLDSDDVRERAAVYMDGLSQMRSEWAAGSPNTADGQPTAKRVKR